jgi:hypothetical protein
MAWHGVTEDCSQDFTYLNFESSKFSDGVSRFDTDIQSQILGIPKSTLSKLPLPRPISCNAIFLGSIVRKREPFGHSAMHINIGFDLRRRPEVEFSWQSGLPRVVQGIPGDKDDDRYRDQTEARHDARTPLVSKFI